jgi:hypothetical protein
MLGPVGNADETVAGGARTAIGSVLLDGTRATVAICLFTGLSGRNAPIGADLVTQRSIRLIVIIVVVSGVNRVIDAGSVPIDRHQNSLVVVQAISGSGSSTSIIIVIAGRRIAVTRALGCSLGVEDASRAIGVRAWGAGRAAAGAAVVGREKVFTLSLLIVCWRHSESGRQRTVSDKPKAFAAGSASVHTRFVSQATHRTRASSH